MCKPIYTDERVERAIHQIRQAGTETVVALSAVAMEVMRAKSKHPEWRPDVVFKAAVVGEEAGELLRAAVQYETEGGSLSSVGIEALHTAATAVRVIEDMNAGRTN